MYAYEYTLLIISINNCEYKKVSKWPINRSKYEASSQIPCQGFPGLSKYAIFLYTLLLTLFIHFFFSIC